ncbi:MAG TPA: Lrp/AsnC family transcriptional regulator [Candidatus Thermoplasmatota archaeon]|nr:Lrp/AsnC family transcriptional regulator [Candidatus Thermoplasmatota archaeon]
MDGMDEKLLELLRGNARESFVNLARQLSTSEGTVRARVKKLQDDGVIRAFTLRTAGSNIKTIIEIEVETNVHTNDISSKIAKWKGVEQVYEISGEHDILVVAEASNTAALNEIIERIREFPQVKSTRSRLILKEV